jgi:hypothetical protein
MRYIVLSREILWLMDLAVGILYVFILWRAAVRGKAVKQVLCEQCGHGYSYQIQRTGWGWPFWARRQAEQNLRWELACWGVDPVPCPACGWYQAKMLAVARWLHHRWLRRIGACLVGALIPAAVFGITFHSAGTRAALDGPELSILALVSLLGFGMMILRWQLARRFDPNARDVEVRKRWGQARAIHEV